MKKPDYRIAVIMALALSMAFGLFVFGETKTTIVMKIGSSQIIYNGNYEIIDTNDPSVAPVIQDDKTYVPVDFMNKKLEMEMDVNRLQTVTIEGTMYVPIRELAKQKGLDIYFKDGVLLISNDASALAQNDAAINEYSQKLDGLPVVGTRDKLKELLTIHDSNKDSYLYGAVEMEMGVEAATGGSINDSMKSAAQEVAESAAADVADDYSRTNVQVKGVDEGDIIKTDGKYIYFSPGNGNVVSIIKATPANDMEEIASIELENYVISEMYLGDSQLIVVASGYKDSGAGFVYDIAEEDVAAYEVASDVMVSSRMAYPYYGHQSFIKVFIYDITDIKNIKEVKSVTTDGDLVSSRKVGNQFFFISQSFINRDGDTYILPQFSDSATKSNVEINLTQLRYYPESIGNTVTTISGINLSKLSEEATMESFLGYSGTVYMSTDNLYITTSSYNYSYERPYASTSSTNIYKYSLSNAKATYSARGKVDGDSINQFSMDEYNSYFRIATTTRTNSGDRSNNLFVLNENMNKTGKLTNIAPGESIYSVRFLGDKAHMVTFEVIDPLFVIDLSNPETPKVLGELKIPGYSTYLHPYDKNHLIGFGVDTVEKDGFVVEKGMKVSLFDITDLSNPKEQFTTVIGDRGTYSELLNNHKVLLFDKEKNILAFPVEVRTIAKSEEDERFAYGKLSFQGAYVYGIDLDAGFVHKAAITNSTTNNEKDYNEYIQRIIYIGDNLYTVSNASVKATSMDTYDTVGRVAIQ